MQDNIRQEKKRKAQEEIALATEKEKLKKEEEKKAPEEKKVARARNAFFSTAVVVSSESMNTFWLKLGKSLLYLLIFLLPLFFLPVTIYPTDINKQFLTVFFVLVSFVCYLSNIYFTRKIIYSKSKLVLVAVLFVFVGGISAVFSLSPDGSLYGDAIQTDVFGNFIIYGLALYLASVFFRKEDFNKIGIVFLLSMALVSILGLLQLLEIYILPFEFAKQTGFSVFGSIINFDIFIAFALVLIVVALAELNIGKKANIGLVLIGLLIAGNLILINYQPIWILLAVMMVIYAIYNFTFKQEAGAGSSVGSSAPMIIGIVAFLFVLISPSLSNVINMPKLPIDVRPNLSATLSIAKDSLKGMRLLYGTGLSTFSSQYNIHRSVDLNQSDFWRIKFNQGFSFISTYLVSAGIIGFLSILLIVFVFARLAVKNIEDKKVMVISSGVVFMILGWFYFPAFFVGLVFAFIALGIIASMDSAPQELDLSRASKAQVALGFVLIIIFAAGAISLFYFSGKKYAAAVYFQNGLKAYNSGNMVKSSENVLRAVFLDEVNDQYLRSASQLLILDAERSRDVNVELNKDDKFQARISDSVQLAKRAAEVGSNNPENWYNLGDIYEKIINIAGGADAFAEESYRKAAELDPKNPDPLISYAKILMFTAGGTKNEKVKEEKTKGAVDTLEKAVNLKPDYAASHFQLASAYVLADRKDDAIKEFEITKSLSDTDAPVDFQLGVLYYNNNVLDKAKTELEAAIALDPDFSNARYILGMIFDKKGQKNKAIEQFEKISELNPDNKEVKDILNNLKTKGTAFAKESSTLPESVINPSSAEKNVSKESSSMNGGNVSEIEDVESVPVFPKSKR